MLHHNLFLIIFSKQTCVLAYIFFHTLCLIFLHSYFNQTIGLLKEDSSLYCISAWNDFVSILYNECWNHNSISYSQLRVRLNNVCSVGVHGM